jgi:hypothetical protein
MAGRGSVRNDKGAAVDYVGTDSKREWCARLHLHLGLASIPVLAISAHVFVSVSLQIVAWAVLLPLAFALAVLVAVRPHRSDRLLLAGLLWGVVACAGYDALRLPTIYAFHWWNDFFGSVGGWATGTSSNFLVGYLWRYLGDGGGIAVVFFALAATLGTQAWSRRTAIAAGVAYGVCPVWTGLILTDVLAPSGRELFPLSSTTLALSLAGHVIYGAVLGFGYWQSRRLEAVWPLRLGAPRANAAVLRTSRTAYGRAPAPADVASGTAVAAR